VLSEVYLVNQFKHNYEDKGFYSGEEADLTDKENSKFARTEEPCREELETSITAATIELSTIILPVG
jgi:hypothetical protein